MWQYRSLFTLYDSIFALRQCKLSRGRVSSSRSIIVQAVLIAAAAAACRKSEQHHLPYMYVHSRDRGPTGTARPGAAATQVRRTGRGNKLYRDSRDPLPDVLLAIIGPEQFCLLSQKKFHTSLVRAGNIILLNLTIIDNIL